MRAPFPKSLDNAQRLRLRRTLLGYSGYLIYVAPLAYIQYFGWSAWGAWGLFWIVLAATALNAVFVGLILSGLNKHFADPSMTLLQITAAIVFALILIYITPEARGVLLFLFMTSLFFGVFRLRMHEFLGLVLFSAAGYFIVLRLEFAGQPFDRAYQLEILRFITVVSVLLWFSVLGGYVAKLRTRLREKNSELARALETITAIARQDELTRTFNRRHMLLLLAQECERTRRYGGAVCPVYPGY